MAGADVEGFVWSQTKETLLPCVGLVPGTKDRPHQIPGLKKGFCIQEDNVMVEWNIPPQKTGKGFAGAVRTIREAVDEQLPEGCSTVYTPVGHFHPKDLTSQQARTMGCEPDFDAYAGGEVRTVPADLISKLHRGAGGHIHIGGDFQCPDFVAALFADLCIGITNHIIGDKQNKRTEWYGKPGIYRPKPYGNSTITLSKWLTENDAKVLQTTFRDINWKRIHNYLLYDTSITDRAREREQIIDDARRKGAPL
jgi:hypothetical protein